MSNQWQCPRCNTINLKPDSVLRLSELRQKLGVVSVGSGSEPKPRCSQCGYEADVNSLLEGKHDPVVTGKPAPAAPAPAASAPQTATPKPSKPINMPDRPALIVIGVVALSVCLCTLAAGGGGLLYLNRSRLAAPPASAQAPKATPTKPDSPVTEVTEVTEAAQAPVRITDPSEAQRITEQENPPYLPQFAGEEYTTEEIAGLGPKYTYTVELPASEPVSFGWAWCTTTQEILDENFEHLIYTFKLDGQEIPLDRFVVDDYFSDDMEGYCREYYTVLTDWLPGNYTLERSMEFDQLINDGWDDYQAGTTIYEYDVTVTP
jgi:hypothetical protein